MIKWKITLHQKRKSDSGAYSFDETIILHTESLDIAKDIIEALQVNFANDGLDYAINSMEVPDENAE